MNEIPGSVHRNDICFELSTQNSFHERRLFVRTIKPIVQAVNGFSIDPKRKKKDENCVRYDYILCEISICTRIFIGYIGHKLAHCTINHSNNNTLQLSHRIFHKRIQLICEFRCEGFMNHFSIFFFLQLLLNSFLRCI